MQNIAFTSIVTNTIQVKVSGWVFFRYSCGSQRFLQEIWPQYKRKQKQRY